MAFDDTVSRTKDRSRLKNSHAKNQLPQNEVMFVAHNISNLSSQYVRCEKRSADEDGV